MAPRRRAASAAGPPVPPDWCRLLQIEFRDNAQTLEELLPGNGNAVMTCITAVLERGARANAAAWSGALALPQLAALLAAHPSLTASATDKNGAFGTLLSVLDLVGGSLGPDNPLVDACAAAGIPAALLAALTADAKADAADRAGRPADAFSGTIAVLSRFMRSGCSGVLASVPVKLLARCAIAMLEQCARKRCIVTPEGRLSSLTRMLSVVAGIIANSHVEHPSYLEALDDVKAARLRTAAAIAMPGINMCVMLRHTITRLPFHTG